MFDTDLMEYRVTEDQYNGLSKARHLVNLLAELTDSGTNKPTVEVNRESLAVTFAVIGDLMDEAIPDLSPNKAKS